MSILMFEYLFVAINPNVSFGLSILWAIHSYIMHLPVSTTVTDQCCSSGCQCCYILCFTVHNNLGYESYLCSFPVLLKFLHIYAHCSILSCSTIRMYLPLIIVENAVQLYHNQTFSLQWHCHRIQFSTPLLQLYTLTLPDVSPTQQKRTAH